MNEIGYKKKQVTGTLGRELGISAWEVGSSGFQTMELGTSGGRLRTRTTSTEADNLPKEYEDLMHEIDQAGLDCQLGVYYLRDMDMSIRSRRRAGDAYIKQLILELMRKKQQLRIGRGGVID